MLGMGLDAIVARLERLVEDLLDPFVGNVALAVQAAVGFVAQGLDRHLTGDFPPLSCPPIPSATT